MLPAAGEAPPDARPAGVELSDSERRAETSWVGIPPALLQVAAVFAIVLVLAGVLVGLVARAVRTLRPSR